MTANYIGYWPKTNKRVYTGENQGSYRYFTFFSVLITILVFIVA